jgi:site-specific DNA-methyltransferase (adenine-specific)
MLYHGDCLEVLRTLPDCSVDSVVTDPPYGLSFMGKKWDYDVPSTEIWAECLRVLKPGGHLLAFAGTRTQHRMAVRIEDAGFEIRDMIAWVYGSGFPKSLDVSKAIDKAAGAERERIDGPKSGGMAALNKGNADQGYRDDAYYEDGNKMLSNEAVTEAAQQWAGWGTALKPALEPITVARKPLIGTVAANVLAHGTGAINVDGCRVGTEDMSAQWDRSLADNSGELGQRYPQSGRESGKTVPPGRWPANLIHDGSQMVLDLFPETKSGVPGVRRKAHDTNSMSGRLNMTGEQETGYGDTGSAARFFYCAKTAKKDRDEGLTTDPQAFVQFQTANGTSGKPSSLSEGRDTQYRNTHPTVKPTNLMRYLCRLVTQPGGTVLDPFMGSGSTGKAAMLEDFDFIGIEREADYIKIAEARIKAAKE